LFAPIQISISFLSSDFAIGVARRAAGTTGSSLPSGSRVSGILSDSRRVLWERTNFGLGVVERSTESLDSTLISFLN